MKLIDDTAVAEAVDDVDGSEFLTMDDRELLKSLEKMAAEIDGEPYSSN